MLFEDASPPRKDAFHATPRATCGTGPHSQRRETSTHAPHGCNVDQTSTQRLPREHLVDMVFDATRSMTRIRRHPSKHCRLDPLGNSKRMLPRFLTLIVDRRPTRGIIIHHRAHACDVRVTRLSYEGATPAARGCTARATPVARGYAALCARTRFTLHRLPPVARERTASDARLARMRHTAALTLTP